MTYQHYAQLLKSLEQAPYVLIEDETRAQVRLPDTDPNKCTRKREIGIPQAGSMF